MNDVIVYLESTIVKKFVFVSLMCIITLFCTACVKFSYDIVIDDNDRVSFTKVQAINPQFFMENDPQFRQKMQKGFADLKKEYISRDYRTFDYQDDIYTGVTITKNNLSFRSIMSELKDDFTNSADAFTIQDNAYGKYYRIHLVYDLGSAISNNSSKDESVSSPQNSTPAHEPKIISTSKVTDPVTGKVTETTNYEGGGSAVATYDAKDQEQLANQVNAAKPTADLIIKIPKRASRHNATTVLSDTEYYWDLSGANQPIEVILEYQK